VTCCLNKFVVCKEIVNQIYDISKSESVSPYQLPNYVRQKQEGKQRIEEQIQEVNAILQTKNVKAKAINEHVKVTLQRKITNKTEEKGISSRLLFAEPKI
jgi:hypothetical protein